ncbi:zinc finger protein 469 [Octodon degus]|uniref:Zinc finger protein 469 n=1 Tax=Octodon degus TaxID=10160 RepID=A0A6P3FUG4_OCTDE|nr:zinc finger protein 469 [Octodon degus]
MPGERPHEAPPSASTRDLHPHQGAGGLRCLSQAPQEDQSLSSRTAQAARGTGSRALARDPPKAQPELAQEVELQSTLLRPRSLHGPPGNRGGPQTPPAKSHPTTQVWLASKVDKSPPQLYGLGIASPRAKPCLDEPPEDWPHKAPQDSKAEACSRPSPPGAEVLPTPKELHSQRYFQEDLSSFTSSNYTSRNTNPGHPQAPTSKGASPSALASLPELQASGASSWPPAAEDNFPGANFGVSPTKSEPFLEGSKPGSPRGSPFPYLLQTQAPREDTTRQGFASGALAFAFHQPPGRWPEAAIGTSPVCPLPPISSRLPCYPSPPGTAPLATRPFPDNLHKNMTKVLPEGHTSGHEGLGSPRAPPNSRPPGHFPGQVYGANKGGSSPGPGDTELATPRALPARLPQLWDPTAAPYPERPLCTPPTAATAFFDGPSQQFCLPHSPTVPWSSMFPSPGPNPHQMGVLSKVPFPREPPEWQEGSQGALGATSQAPGPGETLVALRTSPGQPGSSPGLFPYSGLKDPGAQALFFGGTQPQASPRGAPALPPPRVVGVSPSESPLPSPATNTAGSSTCSSLSPLSSSPANPSSEESQLPAPLGPSGFFLPAPQPQETGSPFQSSEPHNTGQAQFSLISDGLGPEGAPEFRSGEGQGAVRVGLRGFHQGPATYAAHHFPLSSASLDQLDVLLTCRQCDRNYSSLAAFLEHRQFCGMLLARHGPQGHLTARKALAPMHPGLLGHSQNIPFLLAGDVQTDGKEDTFRTSFLPSLATPPFPMPASDLDVEDNAKLDDAKLDSLITEALNGMQDRSDSPEIDSSFIDVFADEDPPGPKGTSTGQPPSTRASATPEHHAQHLPPEGGATLNPRVPCPGDRVCPAQSEPNTPCLGPEPTETTVTSPRRQLRRGKQLKLFWKKLDATQSTKIPGKEACLRPRKRGRSTQQPPRDLRTTGDHMDPGEQVPRAGLPAETANAKHPRLPPRKRRARRGSSWGKGLIHKIVLQKSKLYRPQVPPRAMKSQLGGFNHASESEEETLEPRGPGRRGCSRHSHQQWRPGRKMKAEALGRGPCKRKRPGPSEGRTCPAPGQQHSPLPNGDRDSKDTTIKESHPSLGLHQAVQKPKAAEEFLPSWEKGHPRPPTAECPRPGRGDPHRPWPPGSRGVPRLARSGLQDTPSHTEPPEHPDGEDSPACQPRDFQAPAANATQVACPAPGSPRAESSDLGYSPAHFNRDSVGVPAAHKRPQPHSTAPAELFLRPKDPAVDVLPASSSYLDQDHVDPLEPKPPKNIPYAAETDPDPAQSPLTLDSTSLFAGLPENGFDPPLLDSLSPHRATPMPLACPNPLLRKPQIEPLFPPFLLLEEVSPMLPGQLTEVSGPKPFHKKCPHEDIPPPSPAPVPGKRNEHSTAFMSNLSEDELEIKRLVSELESQLQRREGTQGAPRDLGEATCAASPTPACQATPSLSDTAHLAGPEASRPHQEGVKTVSTRKGALGSPQGEHPSATCHPRKVTPLPGHHKDQALGASSGPMGCSLSVLSAQESRDCEIKGDSRAPKGMVLPDPQEHPEVPLEPGGSAEYSPGHDLLSLRSDESTSTPKSKGSPPQLCWEQSGRQPPEPRGCPATQAPDEGLQGSGDVSLDAIPPTDAGHSHASKGPGAPVTLAERSALQSQDGPSHHRPHAGPASRPSHPFQVLGDRTEGEDSIQVLQEPPPANAPSPKHGASPGPRGDRVTGGSPRGMQDTATPKGPKAERQLGSPSPAEKPKAQSRAYHCLPKTWWSTGAPGNSAKVTAPPEMPRPAGATTRLQGDSIGLQEWAQPAPSPQRPSETSACTQQGPEDRPPQEVASPVPPTGGLATATPALCNPKDTPQEALPSISLGRASCVQTHVRSGGLPAGPLSSTSLCGLGDIPSPTFLEASSPEAWPGLSNIPAPTTTQNQDGPNSSTSRTLEDFRREPGGSPACAILPQPGVPAAIKEHDAETVSPGHGVKEAGALQVLGPTSHPPCLTPHLGLRDGHSITAASTGPTSVESTQPGPYPYLEREVEAVNEGQEDVGTSVTQVPQASPQGLSATCSSPAASPSHTASDFGSKSPQRHSRAPHQMPQMEPLSPPNLKQKLYGFQKEAEPTEKGRPPVPCVTCEICLASFRSRPGLSRHKARKHRQHRGTALQREVPGKKSLRIPDGKRPSHTSMCPSLSAGPLPPPGSTAPEGPLDPEIEEGAERGSGVPSHPLNQQLHPLSLMEPREVPKPRSDQLKTDKLKPRWTERREGQRRTRGPRDSPSTTALKPQENVGKGRARKLQVEHVTADWCCSTLSEATADSTPERQKGTDRQPGILEDTADDHSLGVLSIVDNASQKSPGGRGSPIGKAEKVSPGELPKGWKGALTRGVWGPTVARTSPKDPSHASAGEASEDCAGTGDEQGTSVTAGMLVLPAASSSETGSTILSCPLGLLDAPETHSGNPEDPDPPNMLDDDMSFAQLFPPGGRFARKKNPRVYGKRCRRLPCWPPTEPLIQARGDPSSSIRLPTDLSDSGSLCLTCEDVWGNEPMELPETWLLDGALSNSSPGLGLWALEPSREAGCVDKTTPCCTIDNQTEAIPKLHRIPGTWRGLGLQIPLQESPSTARGVSPEPPNLERESFEEGLSRSSEDLEMVGAMLEAQDLCVPGPCEDLARVPSTSTLDLQDEAAGPRQAHGRERSTPGRKGSFKCRVCFRRFHRLVELDLHRLAHSAAPPPTCYMCVERRFSSRQLLREHLQEKHVQGQAGPWACGMCFKEVADIWMYNQHLREHAALFARRGQARRAPGEPSTASEDECASVEQATNHQGPKGSVGRDVEADPRDGAGSALCKSPYGASTPPRVPGSDSPATPSPCQEPRAHSEVPLCAGPVHADCKDPSRDCHHCGKRFPKPFKLQRHLAVHSPQRVYLCPRCPGVYAAHCELRAHLGGAHGEEPEALDVAPTPLFSCERCADVARVTRRAFACSACNYTFARREQLDRHREKHRRACPRPCMLRGVRRPRASEGTLPPKRQKVVVHGAGGPASPGSRALPRLCPQAAPGTAQAQERLQDTAGRPDPPTASPGLPPPVLSPFPDAQPEDREGREPDRALEKLEDEASIGSPEPQRQQASHPVSGKRGTQDSRGRCARDRSRGEPSQLLKEKKVSACHVVPEGDTAQPSHKGSTTKLGACWSAAKPRLVAITPNRTPKLPRPPRTLTEMRILAPRELAPDPENRMKPTTPKAKPRPSSQGNGGSHPGTQTSGDSRPQPASEQLHSATAITPAKPSRCPSQSPTPHPIPPRAQARGSPKGTQRCPGPQDKTESSEKRKKGPGPAKRGSTGNSARAPTAPERPPRAPRKQATPSRVLPTKPRASGQISKTRPQPWEARKGDPGSGHQREVLSKAVPQARRGRSVPSPRPTEFRAHLTAESQSDLLSQLFGQRLTSFKIPLKKDTSE